MLINLLSIALLLTVLAASSYWFLLALASIPKRKLILDPGRKPSTRFLIAIPAHNEASVIRQTVQRLSELNYPPESFQVHVVADYCEDTTARDAEDAGAVVHERSEGQRSGKGAALSWLFQRILADDGWDAVVIFDADTCAQPDFLRIMDVHLSKGDRVIQGQHVISNPEAGWFPALTRAMFLIDNRFQNLGRSNLGWSAKHMGDSICFRSEVLRDIGWGEGLTEDYQLRQRLLLAGVLIAYEPEAIGCGEAALTWKQAQAQRARWLRGASDANRQMMGRLLQEGIRRRSAPLMDGWLQAVLPSYSTLSLISVGIFLGQFFINFVFGPVLDARLLAGWAALILLLMVYPLFGLALECAPVKAYVAVLLGPVFMLWRTWLALSVRFRSQAVTWVRTDHGGSA